MQQVTPALSTIFRASGAGLAERGRLDTTLVRVGDLYQSLKLGRYDVDPTRLFAELRVDLELHFAIEEADSYFGALERDRPALSHFIAELRREHALLLDELDALRSTAADERRWSELTGAIIELVEDFRVHEHKEADLLQESVLRDDGIGAD